MDNSLENLKNKCLECSSCGLCHGRHNVVFGAGNPASSVMFIGEGPGEQEDLQGVPFVGAAGQLLDVILELVDLNRGRVYIANMVKCRPPRNRDPQEDELLACSQWINRQIELINPKIIVCLGRVAARKIISEDFRITAEHGRWFDINGRRVTATYHPSALLRDESKRPEAFEDFRGIRAEIRRICPETYNI